MASTSAEPTHTPPANWDLFRSKPYSTLNTAIKRKIGVYLSEKHVVANDWVILAEALGLDRDEIRFIQLEGKKDCKIAGEIMLDSWSQKGSSTVKVLEDQLISINRYDVLSLLYQSAQSLCQLTCTVVMDQEKTVDLPREDLRVPEQDSLMVALNQPLKKIGLKPDDLAIRPVTDKEIAWDTEAGLLKGNHIYRYQASQWKEDDEKEITENDYDDVEVCTRSPTQKSVNGRDANDIYVNLDVNLGWHKHLPDNKFEIIRVMKDYLKADGYFILRRTKRGRLAVSATYLGKIKHLRIYKSKNQFYFYRDDERKDSVEELLKYYRHNALSLRKTESQAAESNNDGAPPLPPRVSLKLKYPVNVNRELEELHKTLKY